MSKLTVDTIEPSTGTTITIGTSGDTVTLGSGASASGFTSGIVGVSTFTSSGTWTKATRESALGVTIKRVIVEVQGAGSSGSTSPNSEDVAGGAGGGYAKKLIDVSSISSATITVGAGGFGVLNTGSVPILNGVAGGNSSWSDGTNTVTGNGGVAPDNTHDQHTAGGTATGGDINIPGGKGASRNIGSTGAGFKGGESFLGFGGLGSNYLYWSVADDGIGYGSGGGGWLHNFGGSTVSGAGADGIVIVTEIAG